MSDSKNKLTNFGRIPQNTPKQIIQGPIHKAIGGRTPAQTPRPSAPKPKSK